MRAAHQVGFGGWGLGVGLRRVVLSVERSRSLWLKTKRLDPNHRQSTHVVNVQASKTTGRDVLLASTNILRPATFVEQLAHLGGSGAGAGAGSSGGGGAVDYY